MSGCGHPDFEAFVDVHRLHEQGDRDSPVMFTADVRVQCSACGESFAFRGLPAGVDPMNPTVSADGLEARLPLKSPGEIELARVFSVSVPTLKPTRTQEGEGE